MSTRLTGPVRSAAQACTTAKKAQRFGGQTTVPTRLPEQKGGVLERGTAKLYLLELDRTVILSNEQAQQPGGEHREPPVG